MSSSRWRTACSLAPFLRRRREVLAPNAREPLVERAAGNSAWHRHERCPDCRAFSARALAAAQIRHELNYAQVPTVGRRRRRGRSSDQLPASHDRTVTCALPEYLARVAPAVCWREWRAARASRRTSGGCGHTHRARQPERPAATGLEQRQQIGKQPKRRMRSRTTRRPSVRHVRAADPCHRGPRRARSRAAAYGAGPWATSRHQRQPCQQMARREPEAEHRRRHERGHHKLRAERSEHGRRQLDLAHSGRPAPALAMSVPPPPEPDERQHEHGRPAHGARIREYDEKKPPAGHWLRGSRPVTTTWEWGHRIGPR